MSCDRCAHGMRAMLPAHGYSTTRCSCRNGSFGRPRTPLTTTPRETLGQILSRVDGHRVVLIGAGVEAISSSARRLVTMSRLSCAAMALTNAEIGRGGL